MANKSAHALAEKIIRDLEAAVRKDLSVNSFELIPTLEVENRNSSPIIKAERTIGLESWTIRHIYPYAHHEVIQMNVTKRRSEGLPACLLCVALLNPDMNAVWNIRRELILSKKMSLDDELRITEMALSRKPKSNDAMAHRRWVILEKLKLGFDKSSLLRDEVDICRKAAEKHPSNYHAWSHRMWCIEHLTPAAPQQPLSYHKADLLKVYMEELRTNFDWISCHVSDYSGVHYRQFLLTKIHNMLKSSMARSKYSSWMIAGCEFANMKSIISEFLKPFDDASSRTCIDAYTDDLVVEFNYFDMIFYLLVIEWTQNVSMCRLYIGHEALWCYR